MTDSHSPEIVNEATPIGLRLVLLEPAIGTALGCFAVAAAAFGLFVAFMASEVLPDNPVLAMAVPSDFFLCNALLAAFCAPLLWWLWSSLAATGQSALKRFFPPVKWTSVLGALLTGVGFFGLCYGIEHYLTRHYGVDFNPTNTFEWAMFPSTPLEFVFSLAVIGVLVPFVEELYFRGILLTWLRRKMNAPAAVAVSAAAFSLIHFFMLMHPGAAGWIETAEIFGMGVLMGLWVVRSGSVWTSFALHFGCNVAVSAGSWLLPN